MSRSVKTTAREATTLLAVAGALAGTAATAQSKGSALVNSPRGVARQIDVLDGQTKIDKGGTELSIQENLPHGEKAKVTMLSTAVRGGKPNPNSVYSMDLRVWRPKQSKVVLGHLSLVADVSFNKQQNGTWNADGQIPNPGQPNSMQVLGENGQNTVTRKTLTYLGGTATEVITGLTTIQGPPAANRVLAEVGSEAEVLIAHFANHQQLLSAQLG